MRNTQQRRKKIQNEERKRNLDRRKQQANFVRRKRQANVKQPKVIRQQVGLQLTLSDFSDKQFKVVADAVRSGVKNEHSYTATEGLRDKRLKESPIVIRFKTLENSKSFMNVLTSSLHPNVVSKMNISHVAESVRFIAN
jgi:hypothetical protein